MGGGVGVWGGVLSVVMWGSVVWVGCGECGV